MSGTIDCRIADGIATVVIDNRTKRNALTKPMWAALRDRLAGLSGHEDLRCVVLRGAAPGGFGAGADIDEFMRARDGFEKGRDYGRLHAAVLEAVRRCPHPVIAAIDGHCMGASLVLAAAADLRIAADDSAFRLPPVKLGAVLGDPEVRVLLEVLGRAALMEILLEAPLFDAARAREIGLISRAVPAGQWEEDVARTARRIAEGAPLTQRAHKRAIYRVLSGDAAGSDESYRVFDSADFREGYAAFRAKRRAIFKGR